TYFQTMGIRLLKGRNLEASDASQSKLVVLVNEAFVKRHFADKDPIGKHIRLTDKDPWATIVGVVADFRHFRLTDEPIPATYFHFTAFAPTQMTLAIRTRGSAADFEPILRRDLA